MLLVIAWLPISSTNTNNGKNLHNKSSFVVPNKKSRSNERLKLYSGTELNRHSHYCEQDFKSCVSTNSTTRVLDSEKKSPEKSGDQIRAEDRARTGHPDLGKVVLYQMSYFRL